MEYFFLTGAPKSGTTWLQRCIDAHPEAVCSGEGRFHEGIVKPLYNLFVEYNKKVAITARSVYEGQPFYSPIREAEIIEITREIITKIMSRRATPQTLAIGDKDPRHIHSFHDLNYLFSSARLLVIVRDPRDVASSRLHHRARVRGESTYTPGSPAYRKAIADSADIWAKTHEEGLKVSNKFPSRVKFVRYEDLVADVNTSLKGVFGFLDLRDDEDVTNFAARSASFETMSGRSPGVEDSSSFYRKGLVGDWVNHLDAEAVQTIASRCEAGMREFAYQ